MNSLIEIRQAALRYNGTEVLKGVSAQVAQGEFFVIIGPNGAGKTSLLKTIAGLSPLQSGDVLIHGRSVKRYSSRELARVMAMVPQQVNVDFPFTVSETVLMGRYPHMGLLAVEGKRDLEQARLAMEFTEVSHLADRRLGQLSGGELQRVIIARAICQQPEVLLLDEPTASLDPAHQLRVMDLMARFRETQQVTVVMVSHDLNLAATYADRVMLLQDGRVVKIGTPAEVLTEEILTRSYGCHLHVDQHPLLGTPRVSLLPDRSMASGGGIRDGTAEKPKRNL